MVKKYVSSWTIFGKPEIRTCKESSVRVYSEDCHESFEEAKDLLIAQAEKHVERAQRALVRAQNSHRVAMNLKEKP